VCAQKLHIILKVFDHLFARLLLINCIGKQFLLLNVYGTKVDNVVDLKQRIMAEWAALDHSIIVSAIAQWRLRLHACVRAAGGHFEHCLQ